MNTVIAPHIIIQLERYIEGLFMRSKNMLLVNSRRCPRMKTCWYIRRSLRQNISHVKDANERVELVPRHVKVLLKTTQPRCT